MRITLVISSLGSGGAERVLTGMANYWARGGHDVTLITYSGAEDFYTLEPSVSRIRLWLLHPSRNLADAAYRFGRRVWKLRQAIRASRPDCVLSFIDKTNVLTLLACAGLGVRTVVSERTHPVHYPIHRTWARLRDTVYRRADAIVVQTESLRAWAEARSASHKVCVIPNALDQARMTAIANATAARVDPAWQGRIMAMGRMSREKGHDLLLAACAPVLAVHPHWRLELIGDGPLRSELEQLATTLGIAHQVYFHGQLAHPFEVIKTADIFVLPSRVEGFPNVLLEAMALQRACVSFDCPSGPADLIEHEANGLLVPVQDVNQLGAAIRRLLESSDFRLRLGGRAEQIVQRYSEPSVMQRWNQVIAL